MPAISIGKYLIHRLKEVGVETIFGVPGDYNMVLSKRRAFQNYWGIVTNTNCANLLLATT